LIDRWQAVEIGQEGRSVIWHDTMPLVRDFWLAGTGVGTYGTAMIVYQQADRNFVHFNQAHNHYLQVLAEGGVLLWGICAAAAFLFVRAARQRLRADRTGMLWLRVGAAAGLVGLAVSSIWETAARMPANAVLAAVAAAIVLHDTHAHTPAVPASEDR
jgi:O-antigen ligase